MNASTLTSYQKPATEVISEPLIIAVASGKGGVGKTMLTVACAYELSRERRTLMVDLDFFNRGLSGLFRQPRPDLEPDGKARAIPRPSFLEVSAAEAPLPTTGGWEAWQVAERLWHVHYPDTSNIEDDALERGPSVSRQERVAKLVLSLGAWLTALARELRCEAVVLDCHGGPDLISFAAVILADYTLLVSEPDRITMHGTLNFLRKLWRVCGEESPDIHLVFNKVVPAFTYRFLCEFYERELRQEFFGNDLLAVFPLEVYLTKEFERTPILSEVYPYSYLAFKMQLLLRDLLLNEADNATHLAESETVVPISSSEGGAPQPSARLPGGCYLRPMVKQMPWLTQWWRRRKTGFAPWFLDYNVVFGIFALGLVVPALLEVPDMFAKKKRVDATQSAGRVALIATSASNPSPQLLEQASHGLEALPRRRGVYEVAYESGPFAAALLRTLNSDVALRGVFEVSEHVKVPRSKTGSDAADGVRLEVKTPFGKNAWIRWRATLLAFKAKTPTAIPPQFQQRWKKSWTEIESLPEWALHGQHLFPDLFWQPGIVFGGIIWLLTSFMLQWLCQLDRVFVRNARRQARLLAVCVAAAMMLSSVLLVMGLAWLWKVAISELGSHGAHEFEVIISLASIPAFILWVVLAVATATRLMRTLRWEPHPFETVVTGLFLVLLLCGPVAASIVMSLN